jgi:hypothetical protein
MCTLEPRGSNHAAWQRVPAIQVDSAVEEDLDGNTVGDQAEVVLDKRKERVGRGRAATKRRVIDYSTSSPAILK